MNASFDRTKNLMRSVSFNQGKGGHVLYPQKTRNDSFMDSNRTSVPQSEAYPKTVHSHISINNPGYHYSFKHSDKIPVVRSNIESTKNYKDGSFHDIRVTEIDKPLIRLPVNSSNKSVKNFQPLKRTQTPTTQWSNCDYRQSKVSAYCNLNLEQIQPFGKAFEKNCKNIEDNDQRYKIDIDDGTGKNKWMGKWC